MQWTFDGRVCPRADVTWKVARGACRDLLEDRVIVTMVSIKVGICIHIYVSYVQACGLKRATENKRLRQKRAKKRKKTYARQNADTRGLMGWSDALVLWWGWWTRAAGLQLPPSGPPLPHVVPSPHHHFGHLGSRRAAPLPLGYGLLPLYYTRRFPADWARDYK